MLVVLDKENLNFAIYSLVLYILESPKLNPQA